MLRTILAVVAGLIVAVVIMTCSEMIGTHLFPLPEGFSKDNPADWAALMQAMPVSAKLWVVLGWCVASFAGGWVAATISRLHKRGAALAIGVLIVAGCIANAVLIPHPWWMTALGVLLPVPLALLAARVAAPKRS